jgi:hypothetical protein
MLLLALTLVNSRSHRSSLQLLRTQEGAQTSSPGEPLGCVNPSGRSRGAGGDVAPVESGLVRVLVEGVGACWCRSYICCLGVRSRWRRCVCVRVSSRSSRSWCFDMSLRFFAARSLALVWRTATVSFWLRPAGFCGERVGSRSSYALTRCWVGIGSLFGDGGPTRGAVPGGPRSRRASASSFCGLRVRTHTGATSGSSASWPVWV